MSENLQDYFDALERLKKDRPLRVPKGTRVSNDSVALEAGRKKGAIKKSRAVFLPLISAIEAVVSSPSAQKEPLLEQLAMLKASNEKYRHLWENAMEREISLYKQLMDTQEQLEKERRQASERKVRRIM